MKNDLNSALTNSKGRILIVEDDPALTEILESVFSDEGYVIRIVSESMEIKKLVDDFNPDLVLLDYLLPTINGGELCSQLKRDGSCAHISVIIYSAYSRVLMSVGDYGCDLFMEKPFDLNDLLQNVEQLLAGRNLAEK